MRAALWEHFSFTKLSDVKGEYEANCKYCNNTHYKVNSRYGTSNAERHIDNYAAYKTFLTQNPSHVTKFDQRVFVRMFAEATMYHSYPCSMVEHVKLREMLSYLNPQVRHVTRNTILRYCWLENLTLKSILHETLSHHNSKVCFTCACWSACATRGFLTLTTLFIDNNWSLKSQVWTFIFLLLGLSKEWSLKRKAFSITCDNAGVMNVMVARLKSDLLSFGTLPAGGRFFHVHCSVHILNLIVQSGMKVIDKSVLKLREAVNYIATSDACLGFLTRTVHFIDNNWSLTSRILNFRYFPRLIEVWTFIFLLLGLLKEWSLERKAFSITCDNAGVMDVMVARLKSDLLSFGTLPAGGRFFHVHCFIHILNLIVQSGMKVIDKSVLKLREAVNYIAASDACLCTFKKCVSDSKCNFVGRLRLDCLTRCKSTYLTLKRALEAKDALVLFTIVDTSFEFSLTSEEWTIVQFMCRFLGPFHSITELFSGFDCPTANLYFANVLAIEKLLVIGNNHEVDSITKMASVILEKFEKYWGDYSMLLVIAIVLNPRYKIVLMRSAFSKLYVSVEAEARVKEIYDALVEMYKFYDTSPTSSSAQSSHDLDSSCVSIGDAQSNMDA
ncbi:Zinc finger BED domain-containing protein RICESLEEPER 2 [Bienertia sinuspersici]